jgi:hypothetical protein
MMTSSLDSMGWLIWSCKIPKFPQNNIHKQLQSVGPGLSKTFGALRSASGHLLAADQEIADELASFWSKVFSGGDINTDILGSWLREDPSLDLAMAQWNVTLDHIISAIKLSNNSSPGPDRVPYSAYRGVEAAVPILNSAAVAMQQHDRVPPPDVNLANMSCLPEKLFPIMRLVWNYTLVTPPDP